MKIVSEKGGGHKAGFVEKSGLNFAQIVTKVRTKRIARVVPIVKIVIPGKMMKCNHGAALCNDHSETSAVMVSKRRYWKRRDVEERSVLVTLYSFRAKKAWGP
jgi:hypothetical protein